MWFLDRVVGAPPKNLEYRTGSGRSPLFWFIRMPELA